mmetsp:Transcript_88473/g.229555  ORF Transcript_88473/g.229555 Transcript_88473/m.229555 type:complete len:482 (+) Transcript_88473:68-1513(+)
MLRACSIICTLQLGIALRHHSAILLPEHQQEECPSSGAKLDGKGGCIDAQHVQVSMDCCEDQFDCQDKVNELSMQCSLQIQTFMQGCQIGASDISSSSTGLQLTDDSRMCTEECQTHEALTDADPLADLDILRSQCSKELEPVMAIVASLQSFNMAWAGCLSEAREAAAENDLAEGVGLEDTEAWLHHYWNPRIRDHFYTADWNELRHGRYGWLYAGAVGMLSRKPLPGTVPLYRYWKAGRAGDHFYTTNAMEVGTTTLGQVGLHGYKFENIAGYCWAEQVQGTVPLHRGWRAHGARKDHFYTTVRDQLRGYRYEGVACYVKNMQPELVDLLRYWHPGVMDHVYTADWAELGSSKEGWKYEGVIGRLSKTPTHGATPLYRYWRQRSHNHFYTTDVMAVRQTVPGRFGQRRYGLLQFSRYKYEGIAGYCWLKRVPGSIPLFHYFKKKGLSNTDDFYTTNREELAKKSHGYRYRGVTCWVMSS